jgi:DNA polymerase III delta subunit
VDALIAGDTRATLSLASAVTAGDAQPGALIWRMAQRLREVHRAAALLDAGVPEQKAGELVSRQPWLAKKIVARAKTADREGLERAIGVLAELEIDLRGGSDSALDEGTAFSLALVRAAA